MKNIPSNIPKSENRLVLRSSSFGLNGLKSSRILKCTHKSMLGMIKAADP